MRKIHVRTCLCLMDITSSVGARGLRRTGPNLYRQQARAWKTPHCPENRPPSEHMVGWSAVPLLAPARLCPPIEPNILGTPYRDAPIVRCQLT